MSDFAHLALRLPHFYPVAAELHRLNRHWWYTAEGVRLERNKGELLCLVHSELSEAAEGVLVRCMDDHLPHRPMVEVEMADTVIRIGDYVGAYDLDVDGAWCDLQKRNPITLSFHAHRSQGLALIAEIHMHVSRAMEGERKSKMHHILTNRPAVEVELAVVLHKIAFFCALRGLDINGAIRDKVAYNQTRADHTYEARAQAEGKKW